MIFCITGGCGFVGSALCKLVLANGHEVHVIDNQTAVSEQFTPIASRVTVHTADIRDAARIHSVLQTIQPDVCIHLAAMHYIPACNAQPELAHAVNVTGTQNVLEACDAAGVKKVILLSSGAIYADSSNALNESDSTIAPVDVYGRTKLEVELLGKQFAKRGKIAQVVCVRLFNVYGPGETNPHVIPEILMQLKKGDTLRLGNTQPQRDFIYTEDVANGLLSLSLAGNLPAFDIFNLCSGNAFSVEDIIAEIRTLTARPINVETDPQKWRKADKLCQLGDGSKLFATTGFTCTTSLPQGIQQLLAHEGLI